MGLFFRLAAVVAFLLSATGVKADTYRIFDLGSDERNVYGLDAYGHVAFYSTYYPGLNESCAVFGSCFDDYTFGVLQAKSYSHSGLIGGPDNGTPCSYSSAAFASIVRTLCNNGHILVYGEPSDPSNPFYNTVPLLFLEGDPNQAIQASNSQVYYYLDSRGDVVYGQGNREEAYEYYDLSTPTPLPEPSSIALLGTGLLALAAIQRRLT